MISYEVYKVIHLLGIFLLFSALGGSAILALRGGDDEQVRPYRKMLAAAHGVALLVVFVAGFGLMARMGMMTGWPLWIWVKLGIWVALGGSVALVRRQPALGRAWILVLPLIGGVAAYMAVTKPV
jgi:hypothetical protein